MVPDTFHDYFVASAGAAAALIGLLFVAVSVRPEQLDENGDATVRFRPTAALSALIVSLLVSLLALVPGVSVGRGLSTLAVIGLITVLALLVGLVAAVRRSRGRALVRALVLVVAQGVVYVLQLRVGVALTARPDDPGPLRQQCVLIVILFGMAIERAWEFVGANMPGLLTTVLRATRAAKHRDDRS